MWTTSIGASPLATGLEIFGLGLGKGTVKLETDGISQSPKRILQNNVEVREGIFIFRIVAARMGPSRAINPSQTSSVPSYNRNTKIRTQNFHLQDGRGLPQMRYRIPWRPGHKLHRPRWQALGEQATRSKYSISVSVNRFGL